MAGESRASGRQPGRGQDGWQARVESAGRHSRREQAQPGRRRLDALADQAMTGCGFHPRAIELTLHVVR